MIESVNQSEEELFAIKDQVRTEWQTLVKNPDYLTDLSSQKVMFAAGGGLVTRFGENESEIWKGLVEVATDGEVEVAGVGFSIKELEEMGDFYRYSKERGLCFHCIDERLEGDEECLEDEVHSMCGACAAVGQATGLDGVEDKLCDELEQQTKQEVYEDMPNHDSMVILVDLNGADVVLGKKREELKEKRALPFNASIPLDRVSQWSEGDEEKAKDLISTLVKWNVQIARNIIGGDHNELQGLAKETIIVVDQRKVDRGELLMHAMGELGKVEHGEMLEI